MSGNFEWCLELWGPTYIIYIWFFEEIAVNSTKVISKWSIKKKNASFFPGSGFFSFFTGDFWPENTSLRRERVFSSTENSGNKRKTTTRKKSRRKTLIFFFCSISQLWWNKRKKRSEVHGQVMLTARLCYSIQRKSESRIKKLVSFWD